MTCSLITRASTAIALSMAAVCAVPASALACTCGASVSVVWPMPDEAHAPLDTPIVLDAVGHQPDALDIRLEDESGALHALEATRTLDAVRDCQPTEVFLHPKEPLTAGASYRLRVYTKDRTTAEPLATRLFVAGSAQDALETPAPLRTRYLELTLDRKCGDVDHCGAAELLIDPSDDLAPTWLVLRAKGAPANEATTVQRNGPGGVRTLATANVWLREASSCISYEWIDARGHTLEQRELCEPGACTQIPDSLVESSCNPDAPPRVEPSLWGALPRDSCSKQPGAGSEDAGQLDSSSVLGDDTDAGESGCAIGRLEPTTQRSALALLTLGFAALCRRRAKRRSRTPR